jgi:Polysaccharide lyase
MPLIHPPYTEPVNIFQSDFSGQSILNLNTSDAGTDYSFVTDPLGSGLKVVRFDVDLYTSALRSGSYRSEFKLPTNTGMQYYADLGGAGMTYRWTNFVDSNYVQDTGIQSTVVQWHATEDPGDPPDPFLSPPLELLVATNREWILEVRYDSNPVQTTSPTPTSYHTGIFVTSNTPYNWTLFVIWAWDGTGRIRLHCNGSLILSIDGPNAYNDVKGPYLKIGVYYWAWHSFPGLSTITHSTWYYTNTRIDRGDTRYLGV